MNTPISESTLLLQPRARRNRARDSDDEDDRQQQQARQQQQQQQQQQQRPRVSMDDASEDTGEPAYDNWDARGVLSAKFEPQQSSVRFVQMPRCDTINCVSSELLVYDPLQMCPCNGSAGCSHPAWHTYLCYFLTGMLRPALR